VAQGVGPEFKLQYHKKRKKKKKEVFFSGANQIIYMYLPALKQKHLNTRRKKICLESS
jgi:hypothetical protein